MKVATVDFVGVSQYQQGGPIRSTPNRGEAFDAFEDRCWRERMRVSEDGYVTIPGNAIHLALIEAAKRSGRKGPTGGQSRWTKNFESGIMIAEDVKLSIKASEVKAERHFVPSDGQAGGGKRVWKNFPTIPPSKFCGTFCVHIIDDKITAEILKDFLTDAGILIGLGVWRPQNRGQNGRFRITKFSVSNA
jgi:hypothetical protein